MQAWVLHDVGNIQLEEVGMPEPAAGEVVVEVKATGICGSDIPRIYDTGAHKMPLIPGHEFAGVVAGLGEGVSDKWDNTRVAVFPKIPCGKCAQCRSGNSDLCTEYDYVGSRRDGAFAEYVTAPASNLIPLPGSVDFTVAGMMEPFAVASNAIRRIVDVAVPTDTAVAVCGLGTIGMMVIMLLQDAGYTNIYAIGNKPSQLERVNEIGIDASHFIDSKKEDPVKWINSVTNGGVGAYFECVGRSICVERGIESTAPKGQVILVGNPYSDVNLPRNTYWQILRKQLIVQGIWNSQFRQDVTDGERLDDWHYVLGAMSRKSTTPELLISHTFPISQLETGLHIMRDKTEDYCKIMMVNE